MLAIVSGRAGSGKSTYLIQQAKKKRFSDPGLAHKMYFLVPDQYTLQCERDLMEGLSLEGTLDLEVLSMTRLAQRVLQECGGATRIPMDEQGKIMLLRRVLMQHREDLVLLRDRSVGLLQEVSSLIEDLKRNEIDALFLIETADQVRDERLSAKMRDLAVIAQGYEEALSGGYLDPEEAYHLLLARLPQSDSFKNRIFFVDGFTQFSKQGIRILEELLLLGNTLYLAIPYDDQKSEGSLFLEQKKLISSLRKFCERQKIKMCHTHLEGVFRDPELAFLQRQLFSFPFEKYPQTPSQIVLLEASDTEQEARHVVASIARLIREEGLRPRQITVICNNLEDYAEPLMRWFERYDVPVHLDQQVSLLRDPFIGFVLSTLHLVRHHFDQSYWRHTLKFVFVPIETADKEKLENEVLKSGLDKASLREALGGERFEMARPWSRVLLVFSESLQESDLVVHYATLLHAYLEEQGCFEKLQSLRQERLSEGNYLLAGRFSQVYDLFMSVLEQMVSLMGEEEVSLAEFADLLETGLLSKPLGEIPSGLDQVLVGSLARSKTQDIDVLFVMGMNEGVIPRDIAESALVSHTEARWLLDQGLDLGKDAATLYRREKMDLYLALGKPSARLALSYALSNVQGDVLRPSSLLRRLRQVFDQLPITHTEEEIKSLWPLAKPSVWLAEWQDEAALDVRAYLDGQDMSPSALARLALLKRQGQKEYLQGLLQADFRRDQVVRLSQNARMKMYGEQPVMSISRLEKMASCPFAHFIAQGIKPKKREEGVVESTDVGTFFHETFYRFAKQVQQDGLTWRQLTEKDSQKRLDQAVAEVMTQESMENIKKDPSLRRYQLMAGKSLAMMLDHVKSSALDPSFFEVRFGRNRQLPALLLQVDEKTTWELGGIIDRADVLIDEKRALVRLIDYKSGDKDFDFAFFYHGLMLQLAVYAEALYGACDVLGVSEVTIGAALYFHIDHQPVEVQSLDEEEITKALQKRFRMKGLVLKDLSVVEKLDNDLFSRESMAGVHYNKDGSLRKDAHLVSEEELALIRVHGRRKAAELARLIHAGEVGIHPYRYQADKTACQYCEYKAMCFYEEKKMMFHKLEDFGSGSKDKVMEKLGGAHGKVE